MKEITTTGLGIGTDCLPIFKSHGKEDTVAKDR